MNMALAYDSVGLEPIAPSEAMQNSDDFTPELKKLYAPIERPSNIFPLAIGNLMEVYKECSVEGWDGDGALPLKINAFEEARLFLKSLVWYSVQAPEIAPEPSGDIGLQWYGEKDRIFILSFSGEGEIVYVGINGSETIHGKTPFHGELSQLLIAIMSSFEIMQNFYA